MPDIREAVETATRADTVAVIRRDRMRVLEDGLVGRRQREGNALTQIAMRRIRRKPEQKSAKDPCPDAMSVPAAHIVYNKSRRPSEKTGL
jgi:hypothetical protein